MGKLSGRFPHVLCALCAIACAGVLLVCSAASVLARSLTQDAVARVFPDLPHDVRLTPGSGLLPVTEVRAAGRLLGYAFSTWDVVGSLGYSGKPVDITVGLTAQGIVAGAHLVAHAEPILVIGVKPERLSRFVSGFAGFDVRSDAISGAARLPPIVSGASVSSAVIRDAIVRAARSVAAQEGLLADSTDTRRLDRSSFSTLTWQELLDEGAIAYRLITRRDLADALPDAPAAQDTGDDPAAKLSELFVALATPPSIGQNLIGQRDFNRLVADTGPDDNYLLIAANGLYSVKGTAYRRSGLFERIRVIQGARTIRLTRDRYRNVERFVAEGAPELREIGLFVLPADTGFDPLEPWHLDLTVTQQTRSGGVLSTVFALPYELPQRFVTGAIARPREFADTAVVPLWQDIWWERRYEIAVLALVLVALTGLLVFQDAVVRNDRVYRFLRLSFLAVTVVWIGWIAGAQLSVVNVITFSQSLLTGFSWDLFLLDPLVFLLWGFTAVALLFWGRGVFCGWLCPFGALQELLNEGARRLRLPQIKVPFGLHERLWPLKYVIFLGLFAVSLGSVEMAFRGAEVEPFKTVISLKFVREWPFVGFAVALLVAGLFVERFYCRYLCPLGAALAIPARLHMFEWLKRRPQCGTECRVCEVRCTVQAIHPDGRINPNECIHCLNCQRFYHDKTMCPPLIVKEKRRLKREAVAARARTEAEQ